MTATSKGFRTRLEASLADAGLAIPWWVAMCAAGAGAVIALVAAAQRSTALPLPLLALAGLLAVTSAVVFAVIGMLAPRWLKSTTVLAAVAILLTHPVVPDFAPVALVVLVAEMAVTARFALVVSVVVAGIAVLGFAAAWAGLVGFPVYSAAVLLGLAGGSTLRWYVRALDAERRRRDAVREQATLTERQRIAREVHDVVAHSLSITLLHLTGARRALQQDRDVDEAVDALTETEAVGRAAMSDIRRTVGLLTHTPAGTRPLPGIDAIAELVDRNRSAGLDVRYEQDGDPATVSDTTGLGLYRIAQESLANVARHAPDSTARMWLRVGPAGARLTVSNRLPTTAPSPATSGTGLIGMSARARQLGGGLYAGPDGDNWLVDVAVPRPWPATPDPTTLADDPVRPAAS